MASRLAPTALLHRGILRLRGRDSAKFLHAMTTNDFNNAPPNELRYAAFLTPKGRVLYDGFVHPVPNAEEPTYLVEMDRKEIGHAIDHLKEFKLRTKVMIEDASEEFKVLVAGTENGRHEADLGVPEHDARFPMTAPMQFDPRGPVREILRFRRGIVATEVLPSHSDDMKRTASYLEQLYSLGVGEGEAAFVKERSLPFEGNLDLLDGVSFHKGCYVGQELTHRTHVMLVVRKRLVPFELLDAGNGRDLVGPQLASNTSLSSAGRILAWSGRYGVGLVRLNNMDLRSKDAELLVGDGPNAPKVRAWVPPWWPDEVLSQIHRVNAGAVES
jgi:folate-binding protein YgfZ